MDYKIKDLPAELQVVAMERAREQDRTNTTLETTVMDAFSWSNTPEGGEYWSHLSDCGIEDTSLIGLDVNNDEEMMLDDEFEEGDDQIIK